MSKTFGIVLLGGLAFVIVLSLALLTWVWIRSANEPKDNKVTPTKTGQVIWAEQSDLQLVDARLAGQPTVGVGQRFFVTYSTQGLITVASAQDFGSSLEIACG